MKIVNFNSEDINIDKIIEFCKCASNEVENASKNMEVFDWENKSNTLLHTLLKEKRFSNERSEYFFLEDNNKYISSGGIYPAAFDHNIAILQTRAYTLKEYRGLLVQGNYIIPKQIAFAKNNNYKTLIFTFNEYNLSLKKGIEKLSSSNGKLLGAKVPDVFKGWKSLDYPVSVKYTKQWCLYKHLDEKYNDQFFDTMASIRAY